MKKLLLAGTALGLVMTASAFASVGNDVSQTMAAASAAGWYGGVEGGVAIPVGDWRHQVVFSPFGFVFYTLGTDFDIGAHEGYNFGNNFKIELQYMHIRNSSGEHSVPGVGTEVADWDSNLITLDELYEFHVSGLDPYIGVGLGVDIVNLSASGDVNETIRTDTGFAYQFIVGEEYRFNSNVGLYLDYHFVGALHEDSFDDFLGSYNNLINLGLNYYF